MNGYGFDREWDLFDYASLLDDESKKDPRMKRGVPLRHINSSPELQGFLPSSFGTQGTADALKSIDAMMGVGTAAPVGINPAAPARSQPPVVVPEKYERMKGVTSSDRLGALAMGMTAIGQTNFSQVYGGAQADLVRKQREADEYNMSLDQGTKPLTEINGDYLVTYEPMLIQNSDRTYSVNPKSGTIRSKERSGSSGSTGQAYNTYLAMLDNGDIPPNTSFSQFLESPEGSTFQTDLQRRVGNSAAYLESIGIDNPELASQMADGKLKFVDLEGGGVKVYDMAGNLVQEITSAKDAAGFREQYERSGAYGAKSGEGAVTDLQGFEEEFEGLYDGWVETLGAIDRGRRAVELVDEENVNMGIVEGVIAESFGIGDEKMGELMGLSGEELIIAIGRESLVPVSDKDIQKLERLFANIKQSPKLALGILKSFLNERERNLRITRDKFHTRIDRLRENPNIRNTTREADSFIKSYQDIYNFKTAAELLADEEIGDD